jgi:hypothetical protein
MGGASRTSHRALSGGAPGPTRRALCLEGEVSLVNEGGFVHANLDLAQAGTLNAEGFSGVAWWCAAMASPTTCT